MSTVRETKRLKDVCRLCGRTFTDKKTNTISLSKVAIFSVACSRIVVAVVVSGSKGDFENGKTLVEEGKENAT